MEKDKRINTVRWSIVISSFGARKTKRSQSFVVVLYIFVVAVVDDGRGCSGHYFATVQ